MSGMKKTPGLIGEGGNLIMHVWTFNNLESDYAHFDHVSRKTYVAHSFGAKAF